MAHNDKYSEITKQETKRNWWLVLIASIWIVLNLVLVCVGFAYASTLGGWTPVIILAGATSVGMGVMAIAKNEPAWLLLDIILPG